MSYSNGRSGRLPDDELRALVDGATPGRRVQFHPLYCTEAKDADCVEWDSSHDTSVILPDGRRYRGYSHHKHAADAALDGLAPSLAAEVLELRAEVARLRDRLNVQTEGWKIADQGRIEAETALTAERENADRLAELVDRLWLHDDPPPCLAAHMKLRGK